MAGEALPIEPPIAKAYGCVFCVTGKELTVAQHIERVCEDTRAIVARRLRTKTIEGKPKNVEEILYPGYTFFESPVDNDIYRALSNDGSIIAVLSSGTWGWQLYGNDAKVVQWLFSYDGFLPFSQAIKEGDWIHLVSGPLKDLETQILCFDKHRKNALVEIPLCGRLVKTWLKYELIEKV